MATKWLMLETFGGRKPSVIYLGRAVKRFVELDRVVSNRRTLQEVDAAITDAAATFRQVDRMSADGSRRTVVVPILVSPTRLHGVIVWSGPSGEPLPQRDPAGAWVFDIARSIDTRSDEVLALLGIPPEQWPGMRWHSIANVFSAPFTVNRDDLSTALARLVRAEHGVETQSQWAAVRRPDGERRALHYSCRIVGEPDAGGRTRMLIRGITYDVGPASEVLAAPPQTTLADRVLEASVASGEYRAIINPRTLHLLQWQGLPMPGVAWQALAGQPEPALHPDDIGAARALCRGLGDDGITTGLVRVRGLDESWVVVYVRAARIALDEFTTASLITVRRAEPGAD